MGRFRGLNHHCNLLNDLSILWDFEATALQRSGFVIGADIAASKLMAQWLDRQASQRVFTIGRPLSFPASMRLLPLLLGFVLAALSLLPTPVIAATARLNWLDSPQADSSAFARATQPGQVKLPRDFGPHNDFQTEWWYYTGNLQAGDRKNNDRPFGYQLTFFRSAVVPESDEAVNAADFQSNWRGNQLYSAHFTLSDIQSDRFYPFERYSRGGNGLAGAQAEPYEVWLEDWSATEVEPDQVRLQAKAEGVAIDLNLTQSLPPVLQGDRGLSQKGTEPGNASYYYSLVQQPTQGQIILADQQYDVTGVSWKDHEYSTSGLSQGTVGWDWFALQFDNGAALMLYNLRHEDGQAEPTSAGKFITADGSTQTLALGDWDLDVLKSWTSKDSGATYPAQWHLTLPKLGLDIQGKSQMADQELRTATATYWEGAVGFKGELQDQPVTAQGYVEMTGYADRLDSILGAKG